MMAMSARYLQQAAPLLGILLIIALLALLQFAIRIDWLDAYTVPLPTDILAALPRLFAEEHVVARFAITAGETFAAGLMALVTGLAAGIVLHRWQHLRTAFEPWVAVLAAAPLVLAYPLFLVLFGRGPLTIIVIGFASALAPVILKTIEGFAAVRRVLLDVGRSLRLSGAQEFCLILLPAALPHIFTGLRLALVFALINVVGVEFLINLGGLGQLINNLAERYDLPGTWGAIGLVVLVSILFFLLLDGGERWLRRRA
jgi:NitT/TauT family transport system permease protein